MEETIDQYHAKTDHNAVSEVWKALGITEYTGRSIWEHVTDAIAERDSLRTERDEALREVERLQGEKDATPLCPLHQSLENRGKLEVTYGNLCIACSLNEREALLDLLAPLAPRDGSADSLNVMRKVIEFWETHQGENRVVVSYPAPSGEINTAANTCYKHGRVLLHDGVCSECVGQES